MKNILRKAIPGGLTNVVLILSAYVLFRIFGVEQVQVYTACTIVFAISGLAYLFRVCQPFDWYRKLVWGGCTLGLLVCFTFFRWYFAIENDMPLAVVLAGLGIGLLAYPLLDYLNKFGHKVESWYQKRKK